MARAVAYGVIALLAIAVVVRGWGSRDELLGRLPRFGSAPDTRPPADGQDSFEAFVVEAGDDWIKVRKEGETAVVRYPVAGAPLRVDSPEVVGIGSYHISDVRPGDKVSLWLFWRAGVPWCEEIMIRRRPGGRVPPIRDQINMTPDFPEGTWAHRMNALQDWEERGVPLPPQYQFPPAPIPDVPFVPADPNAVLVNIPPRL